MTTTKVHAFTQDDCLLAASARAITRELPDPRPRMTLWWRHARWPLLAFALLAVAIPSTGLDLRISRALFFDAGTGHWVAADAWWANDLVHTGGRWLVRIVAALAIAAWALGRYDVRFASWRRPAGYLALAIILSTGIVGLLKTVTNVDCPFDLAGFGGDRPYVALFADRPDNLPHARCFPAAHASSGYSLLAFYFLWRERNPRRARSGLLLGIGMGLLFGITQQARGAHFVSHDVSSAMLVWLTCLNIYVFGFKGRLQEERGAVRS